MNPDFLESTDGPPPADQAAFHQVLLDRYSAKKEQLARDELILAQGIVRSILVKEHGKSILDAARLVHRHGEIMLAAVRNGVAFDMLRSAAIAIALVEK